MRTNIPGGIRVVARTPDGALLEAGRLAHGQHPATLLGQLGLRIEAPRGADVVNGGALELAFSVRELSGIPLTEEDVPRDPDVAPEETGDPFQRVAAYAIVTSERGVLLTQFNDQTHIPGEWGLPGGGLEEGETPAEGVHREVWEETGQRIALDDLVDVQSSHWIGRAPNGVVEDFHAIRIVYRATCREPRDVVIHDVGGTTADARWVPVARLGDYRLSRSWHHLSEAYLGRP